MQLKQRVEQEADELLQRIRITLPQCKQLLLPHQRVIESMVPLLDRAFRTFDRDGSGTIDESELKVPLFN